jgi:hypothetical protein
MRALNFRQRDLASDKAGKRFLSFPLAPHLTHRQTTVACPCASASAVLKSPNDEVIKLVVGCISNHLSFKGSGGEAPKRSPLHLYVHSYFSVLKALLLHTTHFTSAFDFPPFLRLVNPVAFLLPLQDVFLLDKNPMGVTD